MTKGDVVLVLLILSLVPVEWVSDILVLLIRV